MANIQKLTNLLRPAAEALGFEFVGLEYIAQGKHSVLRLYIDHEDGITVEDCVSVSHQASGILEVDDPISSQFNLEVSSPGLERPLFTMTHFERFVGQEIKLRCHVGVEGRRKFRGTLSSASNDKLVVIVDGQEFSIEFNDVDKANLVPEFD